MNIASSGLVALISVYRRFISPLFPSSCRFTPTCSQYAAEAISTYGAIRGSWMAIMRIGRCNPFHPGGYDPVPRPHNGSESSSNAKSG